MKVGDLVRFNSAGQRLKSMALVLAFEKRGPRRAVKLMWVVVPEVFPAMDHNPDLEWKNRHKLPTWYKNGDWIEVINESR